MTPGINNKVTVSPNLQTYCRVNHSHPIYILSLTANKDKKANVCLKNYDFYFMNKRCLTMREKNYEKASKLQLLRLSRHVNTTREDAAS